MPGAVRARGAMRQIICRGSDYVASNLDEGVLKLAPRAELSNKDVTHVFGYARDLPDKVS